MPNTTLIFTIVIVVLALCFDFINGFHDCANAIATSVTTKVLTMRQAIIMSATLNFVGALMGVGVAKTIGSDMMNKDFVTQKVVLAALIAAIIWDLITWYYGLPSSSSHALIGGLIGAAILANGAFSIIHWGTFLNKIVLWLILSPIIGFIAGYIIMKLLNILFKNTRPTTVSKIFSKAQIVSAGAMAFMHGSNDAQKSMGVITMALVSAGTLTSFKVPLWVILACATAMALGTSLGGAKIIKTVGSKMAKLAPVNGFAAETAGALVISFATYISHAPVSTTHTITSSIMGVGASKRINSVKWSVVNNIVLAWVLTIPACALIAGAITIIIKLI
jgi:inorganic phosphate transporter, PiT family